MAPLDSADRELWAPDFIGQLCIALAHRWEPERLFVILTAFFDESGTHAGSPITVMGGFMGNARQWAKFQVELDRLKRGYGFRVFHATHFKSKKGEFAGWKDTKRAGLIYDLTEAVGQLLMAGVTSEIGNDDFEHYYRKGDKPRRVRLDTAYGLSFRGCLSHCVHEAVRRLGHHPKFSLTKLHVVLENGHRHSGDANRVFGEIKAELDAQEIHLLSTFTLAKKDECDPLMASDFLSHTLYMTGLAGQVGAVTADASGASHKAGLHHLQFGPEGLVQLRASLVERPKFVVNGRLVSAALLLAMDASVGYLEQPL